MLRWDDTTRTLIAAISLIAMVGIGLSLTLPLLSVELERMGTTAAASGLATAIAGGAAILISPVVPRLAIVSGVGRLLMLAIALNIAVLACFKLTMNYWAWLPLRFLFSASLAVLFILSEFWISAAAPAERRGIIMGIYATVLSLGFAAGPTLLALVGTTGWQPYLAGGGLFLLAALPLLLARAHWPTIPAHVDRPVMAYIKTAPLAAAAGFASGAVETGAMGILPVLGLRLNMDASAAALLVSAVALGNVLTQIPIGWLSDRLDRRRLLIIVAIAALALSMTIAALSYPGARSLPLVLMAWGGFAGAFYTVGLAHLASRFAATDLVSANAAFILMFNVGVLAGPPLAGAAVDVSTRFGFGGAMALFAVLILCAARLERRSAAAR
jgi:MFS family permease